MYVQLCNNYLLMSTKVNYENRIQIKIILFTHTHTLIWRKNRLVCRYEPLYWFLCLNLEYHLGEGHLVKVWYLFCVNKIPIFCGWFAARDTFNVMVNFGRVVKNHQMNLCPTSQEETEKKVVNVMQQKGCTYTFSHCKHLCKGFSLCKLLILWITRPWKRLLLWERKKIMHIQSLKSSFILFFATL